MPPSDGEPLSHADICAMKRGPLPDWLLAVKPPLTASQILCYARLLRRVNDKGRCWPQQDLLAAELRCSERHVRTLIQQLADLGLVRIEPRGRQNEYVLLRNQVLMSGSLAPAEESESGTPLPVSTPRKPELQFRSNRNSTSGINPPETGTPVPITPELHFRSNRNSTSGDSMKSTQEVYSGSPTTTPEDSAETEAARKVVVAELGNAGVHLEIAARLVARYPEALEKARRWAKWLPSVRRGMEREGSPLQNVEGYLARHLSGRCHTEGRCPCVDPHCDTPRHYLDTQPRAVATRTPAPRPAQPAGDPVSGTSVLPEIADVWERIRRGVSLEIRAYLSAATAVDLQETALVIEMPATNAGLLNRHREKLLQLAQSVRPEISDLRFDTHGGRNA